MSKFHFMIHVYFHNDLVSVFDSCVTSLESVICTGTLKSPKKTVPAMKHKFKSSKCKCDFFFLLAIKN